MANIRLEHLFKIYENNVTAVTDFCLQTTGKEFIVFVGPSGCGKSTTLRMIAGLEEISKGEFYLDDQLMNDVPPKERNIAMVFQNYALYPHMSVYENMAFGLKLRKITKDKIDQRVQATAKILGLENFLQRKPKALSGGQRQRVALGRAIVREAKIFLMDEPLSNLDTKLRVQMRAEIIKLYHRLNSSVIYVTHDQTEAMTMATRLVVMKDGKVQQIGTPREVYDCPANLFVAGFIGSPAMNFLRGQLSEKEIHIAGSSIKLPAAQLRTLQEHGYQGKEIVMGIRPENLHESENSTADHPVIPVAVEVVELMGSETVLHGHFHGQSVIARVDARSNVKANSQTNLAIDTTTLHFFDPASERRIC